MERPRRAGRKAMEKKPYHMAKCRDCGAVRKVTRREMNRRAPARCWKCGGCVDLSESGKDDFGDAFRVGKAITDQHMKVMQNR